MQVLLDVKAYLFQHIWILEIFSIVFATLVARRTVTVLYRRWIDQLNQTRTYWDNSFVEAVYKPLAWMIWLLGISYAAQIAGYAAGEHLLLFSAIPLIRKVAALVLVVWFLQRFIREVEKNYIEHHKGHDNAIDVTTINAVSQLLSISVLITSTLVGMQLFNMPVTGLLAFGSVGSAGVVFAAKDLLANFFGGIMIYMDRPFSVGDWIRSPDKSIEGTVEQIGWRCTRIRTFDKRPLYVPNGTFLTISVENPSRMSNRRIKTFIGLRYSDAPKVETVLSAIEDMLRNHPEIDTNQTLMVNLVNFADSSLEFMVYTFTKTTNWVKFQAIQQDVFLKIIDIITQHGAECAFPTRTLELGGDLSALKKETFRHDNPEAYPRSV